MTTPDPALTDEMLASLKALEAKSTPGPWQTRFMHRMLKRVRESPGDLAFNTKPEADWPDCELIAAARNALPALISAAFRTLAAEAASERIRKQLDDAAAKVGAWPAWRTPEAPAQGEG